MLAFFGIGSALKWGRIVAVLLLFTVVIFGISGAYKYVAAKDARIATLTADNATLASNNLQLEEAIKQQLAAIESLESDILLKDTVLVEVREKFNLSRDQVRDLQDRLGRHELGYLALNRPVLVEKIINDATREVARCYEIAAGAPLTDKEKLATKPSEINSECPELANPAYNKTLQE